MPPIADRVEGLLHEPTQVREDRVDLTAAAVFRVDEAGRIDFGGGELEAAELTPVETERRNPDDDYGWWNLQAGQYVVAFNESLAGDEPVRLQPRRELLVRGGNLPTIRTASFDRVPLSVPEATGEAPGLRLKENARVATVLEV